jgi:hypothetical protein
LTPEEASRRLAWDCYFAGVLSISMHPKAGHEGARSVEECAAIADRMLEERELRFPAKEY